MDMFHGLSILIVCVVFFHYTLLGLVLLQFFTIVLYSLTIHYCEEAIIVFLITFL